MLRPLRLLLWLALYAPVGVIAWAARARSRGFAVLAIFSVFAGVAAIRSCRTPALRIATWNIENYGMRGKRTDEDRLRALLADADADVVAVQEIQDAPRFARLVAGVSGGGRRYAFVSSRCGGKRGQLVGFVVDTARVRLRGTEELPQLAPGRDDACSIDDRPGLLGRFAADGHRFDLLVVHFAAGAGQLAKRLDQWDRALQIADGRQAEGEAVAIMGDVNSTGYRDDAGGERTAIRAKLRAAGMRLLTEGLACSEYYRPQDRGQLEASALDHFAATADFPIEHVARVRGYCAEVRCQPRLDEVPADYANVSDHCPVVVGGR